MAGNSQVDYQIDKEILENVILLKPEGLKKRWELGALFADWHVGGKKKRVRRVSVETELEDDEDFTDFWWGLKNALLKMCTCQKGWTIVGEPDCKRHQRIKGKIKGYVIISVYGNNSYKGGFVKRFRINAEDIIIDVYDNFIETVGGRVLRWLDMSDYLTPKIRASFWF